MSTAHQRRQQDKFKRAVKSQKKYVAQTEAAKAAAAQVQALLKLRKTKVNRAWITSVEPGESGPPRTKKYRKGLAGADKEKVRQLLLWRDGDKCGICGKCFGRAPSDGDWSMTIDHVRPLSKGGTHGISNLRMAHQICNSRRGNRE